MRNTRSGVVDGLVVALREQAGRALMLHQAVADRLGLGPSDMKAFDLARAEPELTPSRLARITGLSTSATTAVLDRLERRGLVERRRDGTDRRKVVISVRPEDADHGVTAIFAELERDVRGCLDGYSDDELAVLDRFVRELNTRSATITARLTDGGAGGAGPSRAGSD